MRLSVSLSNIGKRTAAVAIGLAIIGFGIRPAMAQITFGSPGDPPHIALGAGAFDVTPSHHRDSKTTAELRAEYRFGDVFWILSPFIGTAGTSDGAFYGYGGFGIDINFGPSFVLTPNVAVGYFARGNGTALGSWVEFRSGAELAYRFADQSRLGIAIHHTSNAGLTKVNPGEQSIMLMYSVPIR